MVSSLYDYLQIFRAKSIWLIGFLSISISFFWYLPGVEVAVGEDLPIPASEYLKNSEGEFLVLWRKAPTLSRTVDSRMVRPAGLERSKLLMRMFFKGGTLVNLILTRAKRRI